MKKNIFRFSAFFIALFISFLSIPFQDVKAVPSWDNIIYALKTNLGIVSAENGTLSGIDNNTFYGSLYETTLYWDNSAFVPAETFSSKAEWIQTCSNRGNPDVIGFHDFDIVQSLEQSGYISVSDGNYDFSNFPKLGNSVDTSSPLDGVDVVTNFGDFNPYFSYMPLPSYYENFVNSLRQQFISTYGNVVIFCGDTTVTNQGNFSYSFYSLKDSDYFFVINNSSIANYFQPYFYSHSNNNWVYGYIPNIFDNLTISNSYQSRYFNSSTFSSDCFNYITTPNFYDSNTSIVNSYRTSVYYSNNSPRNHNMSYWSNMPLVFASSVSAGQNYYYWLKGSPSGQIYTTSNTTNNVYSQEFIENNDWQEIYNNYVTDVSNYYSTTENITNENLTQYIDQSTTITNITNNYITNNNGGGGSGEDDIITNSWLERIYNLLLDFYFAFIGTPTDSGSGSNKFYTDNSIKNDVINYPLSEWFPNLPEEYFIPESSNFTWPLFSSKVARVLETAMPFCYIEKLKYVATFVATPPQEPHYEIPFVIESFGIDETVNISFEDSAWSVLHSVWIVLFMIIFIIALFYFTYRFILLVSTIIG